MDQHVCGCVILKDTSSQAGRQANWWCNWSNIVISAGDVVDADSFLLHLKSHQPADHCDREKDSQADKFAYSLVIKCQGKLSVKRKVFRLLQTWPPQRHSPTSIQHWLRLHESVAILYPIVSKSMTCSSVKSFQERSTFQDFSRCWFNYSYFRKIALLIDWITAVASPFHYPCRKRHQERFGNVRQLLGRLMVSSLHATLENSS